MIRVGHVPKRALYYSANLFVSRDRVWKGNSRGNWDLTKLRCEIREKAKYIDGIRDLTAPREAGFVKIWGRDAGFFAFLSKFRKLSRIKLGKKYICRIRDLEKRGVAMWDQDPRFQTLQKELERHSLHCRCSASWIRFSRLRRAATSN